MLQKIISAIGGVLLVVALCFQSALADRPIEEQFTQEFYGFPLVDCEAYGYGFTILADAVFVFDQLTFLDNQGNVKRIRVKWRLEEGSYENSTDPSKRIDSLSWGANQWIDVATGETVQTGAYTKVTVPGWGVLAVGVGRVVINGDGTVKFYNGKANFIEGDLAKLCAYLA